MNELLQTIDDLRRMSTAELIRVGEDSLLARICDQALEARERHGGLRPGNLDSFLEDRDSVRYPTRLVLEYGEMGLHQFAQPEPDYRVPGGCILYVRPALGARPDLLVMAVAYMIPVINYGDIVSDAHCLAYGAALLGMDEQEYYDKICAVADETGARAMAVDDPNAHVAEDQGGNCASGGSGCGGGCDCGGG